MADNYLEKRMEELRSGKTTAPRAASAGIRKGILQFPLPEKRVLVTGGAHAPGLAIAREFIRAGCRVAIFDPDTDAGHTLALNEGIRYHPADLSDSSATADAFRALLKAWRDVDIVVCADRDGCEAILSEWSAHKKRFPIPSDYGVRLISVGFSPDSPERLTDEIPGLVASDITAPQGTSGYEQEIARACLFISLPTTRHNCRIMFT